MLIEFTAARTRFPVAFHASEVSRVEHVPEEKANPMQPRAMGARGDALPKAKAKIFFKNHGGTLDVLQSYEEVKAALSTSEKKKPE